MPSEPELICHEPPCNFYKEFRKEYQQDISELQLCHVKLGTIEARQAKYIEDQKEFREKLATMETTLAVGNDRGVRILEALTLLTSEIKSVKATALDENDVKVMLQDFTRDIPNGIEVDRRIEAGVAKAVKEARSFSSGSLWKISGLVFAMLSALMSIMGLGFWGIKFVISLNGGG